MHLRQVRYKFSAYETFTKNKKRIAKIYRNKKFKINLSKKKKKKKKIDKACFQYHIAYGS